MNSDRSRVTSKLEWVKNFTTHLQSSCQSNDVCICPFLNPATGMMINNAMRIKYPSISNMATWILSYLNCHVSISSS